MKAWFWLFVITGTYCWALAQEQNPFWAAGVDTAGKAVVQTNVGGNPGGFSGGSGFGDRRPAE